MRLGSLKAGLLSLSMLAGGGLLRAATPYTLAKEQILRVGNSAEPKGIDPSISTGVPESHIVDNLFEGLTTYDPYTLDPRPGVAERWEISQDGKTYKFYLRKNAKWSDGKPVTAEDFVWSWTRVLEPKTASEYAYQLYYIKNGEAFNQGKVKDFKQLGVKALDPYTLQVELEHPTPFFLRLTSFHTLLPTPRAVIEKHGDRWTSQGNIVSNGPFMLEEWKMNQHIKLSRNTHYWDQANVALQSVIFYPTENADTEEKQFEAGDLDITGTVPVTRVPHYMAMLKKAKPGEYVPFKNDVNLGVQFYRFNVTKKPFDDLRVRQAFAMTVDRQLLVEKVLRAGQVPATHYTPDVVGYSYSSTALSATVTPEVIAKAKALLKEAGYPDGKGLPKVEILYNTSDGLKKIAVAIQQMWKKNLGVEVGLFNQEWKVYLDTQRKMDFTISRSAWLGDYPDPNTFLDMYVTNGGNNNTGWSNKRYDELIDLAGKEIDQAKRFAYFKEAEDLLMQELPIMPLYFIANQKLVSPKVKMVGDNKVIREWTGNIMERMLYKHYVLVTDGKSNKS